MNEIKQTLITYYRITQDPANGKPNFAGYYRLVKAAGYSTTKEELRGYLFNLYLDGKIGYPYGWSLE